MNKQNRTPTTFTLDEIVGSYDLVIDVLTERGRNYSNDRALGGLENTCSYTGLTIEDTLHTLIALKISRLAASIKNDATVEYQYDHWLDIVGYSFLGEESLRKKGRTLRTFLLELRRNNDTAFEAVYAKMKAEKELEYADFGDDMHLSLLLLKRLAKAIQTNKGSDLYAITKSLGIIGLSNVIRSYGNAIKY